MTFTFGTLNETMKKKNKCTKNYILGRKFEYFPEGPCFRGEKYTDFLAKLKTNLKDLNRMNGLKYLGVQPQSAFTCSKLTVEP